MDNNNQAPLDPSQQDNAQNEYQKILDQYAQELAQVDTTPEATTPPQMPLQSTETPDVNQAQPSAPLIEPISNEPALPTLEDLENIPSPPTLPPQEPATDTNQFAFPQPPTEAPELHPLPPEFPPVTAPNLPPQEPVASAPASIPEIPSLPELPPLPPVETSTPTPELPPVDTLPSMPAVAPAPIRVETPMPPEPDTSTPDLPNFEPTPPSNNDTGHASALSKYFFIVSLLIFLATAAGVFYTYQQSQNLKKSLEVNPPGGQTPTSAVEATCVLTDDQKYATGESFDAADGCNTCTCLENGTISCTEMACDGTTKGGLESTDSAESTEATPTAEASP